MQTCRFVRTSLAAFRPLQSVRLISTSNPLNMPIKVGEKIPSVQLAEGSPDKKVDLSTIKGKIVIFGVPGAFTPTCNDTHAPTFINQADAIMAKGAKEIFCIATNDCFVMAAWGKAMNASGKVRFVSDATAEFVKKADLSIDLTAILGSVRSTRFCMVVEDGVVKGINVEADPGQATCSKADGALQFL